jgi:hypothetical protein
MINRAERIYLEDGTWIPAGVYTAPDSQKIIEQAQKNLAAIEHRKTKDLNLPVYERPEKRRYRQACRNLSNAELELREAEQSGKPHAEIRRLKLVISRFNDLVQECLIDILSTK